MYDPEGYFLPYQESPNIIKNKNFVRTILGSVYGVSGQFPFTMKTYISTQSHTSKVTTNLKNTLSTSYLSSKPHCQLNEQI